VQVKGEDRVDEEITTSRCAACKDRSILYRKAMIFPAGVRVAFPNADLNDDIRADFQEAADILDLSHRGSAALLRLCVQKLCIQLGEKGKDLDKYIAKLVKRGLSVGVQRSLDIVRVVGNNAVHPGVIDVADNRETAVALFTLVNLIADRLLSEPKRIAELYESLPQSARDAIEKRDGVSAPSAATDT
jgi:hypothetical protein